MITNILIVGGLGYYEIYKIWNKYKKLILR